MQHSNAGRADKLVLTLHSLLVQGTVPYQLGSLAHLQCLNLSSNQLSGSLPASLGQLQAESGVWLDHNSFTGTIPEPWCNASLTSAVHVDHNQGLFGDVPHCLEGRLGQGRGLEGTGLDLPSSSPEQQPALSSQTSSSDSTSSSSSDAAVFCNSAACGSVFFLSIIWQCSSVHFRCVYSPESYNVWFTSLL